MPKKRKVWKSEQKLGADLLWGLPRAGCGSWADHPPSLLSLEQHHMSNGAELHVSQERWEDEWLRSPLIKWGVILGLDWAIKTSQQSHSSKAPEETQLENPFPGLQKSS